MTNQEIYDELGQMGSLLFIGVTLAGIDGKVDKSELDSLVRTFSKFAPEGNDTAEDLVEWLVVINKINGILSIEQKVGYIREILKGFKNQFNDAIKANIVAELTKIAKADGEVHKNEAALLGMCMEYLL